MLCCTQRDPKVEFVADQLKRAQWISGYTFIESEGYRLQWSPQGSHRMILLQIALKESGATILEQPRPDTEDRESNNAIQDFWDACVTQLALKGERDSLPAYVKIIESWKPHSR
jgi:hypothetical protein